MRREDCKDASYFASNNPDNEIRITLNNKLLRILSLIGKDLPFSAFERSQSKAKFSSMSIKHGFQSSFLTLAPPEQDDLSLLKLHLIRQTKNYNGKFDNSMFEDKDFQWFNLPEDLRSSPRKRLLVSQKMPAQCVFTYLRAVDALLNKLIKCPQTKSTRVSSTYFDRKNSVLGKVGGIMGVTEPQSDSRLHLHMLSYSSTISPSLLSRVIPYSSGCFQIACIQ